MQTLFPIEASIKPVTALLPIQGQAFTSGLLFAGQGFNIQVQDTRSNRVLLNSQVFSNQIVHGIRTVSSSQALQALLSIQDPDFDQSCCSNTDHGTAIESHEVIIWGGRWIRRGVFAFCSKDGCVQLQSFWLSKPFECLDWILDICKDIGSQGAIAVTAHNDLLAIPPESLGVRVLGRGSRSILYSAHVMWKDDHTLLIAGGTAFGQILVQTCAFEGEIVTIRTHYVFSGHEGSIFGVRLSDPLPQPDRKSLRLLSSCSDDRTVRLWDVSDLSPLVASGTVDERETGFLASKTEDCLASGVGHISRVWSLRYIYHTEGTTSKSIIKIVSAGEDATCRVWDLRRHENSQYALEAVGVINNHAGKNIWSMEVMLTMDRPETCNIFTGGADGAILTSSVKSSRNPSDSDSSGTWDIQDISYLASSYATPDSTILQRECFRAMTLVQDGAILVASNEGQVFFSAPATNNSQSATLNTWTLIETIPGLKGYSVSASTASGSFAVIAGASGMVYCFDSRTQSLHEIYQAKRKVYALWIEQNPCSGPELRLDLVVFELGNDKTTLLHLNSVQPGSVQISGAFTADTYASTPTTAACCFKGSTQFLALGFRNGIIKIYNSNELPFTAAINHTEEPISLTTYAVLGNCGTETVTHLQWIYDEDTLYIASVGRDGYFSIHAVPTEGHSHPMLLHRLVLPFGPNVEGFWICPITSNLIVYGFHSTNMIVYNVSTAREVASITCGGAHRTWSLQINSARSPYGDMVTSCTFAWTQIRQLRRQQVSDANFRVLQPGGHGRDVKTCSTALVAILKNGDLTHLIATGAEDTDIRLFEKGQSKVECVATLRKHATGVRCLKWSSDGRYLFSSGGKEEFFVWRICQSPIVHCGIVCEAVLPVRDGGSELRIMSFDVNEQDNFRTDTAFVITLVYSNSVIKTYMYVSGHMRDQWKLLASNQYTTACLTRISYLDGHLQSSQTIPPFLTTSTDGDIVLWHVQQNNHNEFSICIKRHLHQNAITACTVTKIENNRWLILTGGDDNALGISLVLLPNSVEKLSWQIKSFIIPNAHTAAVTGISLVKAGNDKTSNKEGKETVIAVTVGLDQRIRTWNVEIDSISDALELTVSKRKSIWTSISDPSDVIPFPSYPHDSTPPCMIVCGVGLELRKFEAFSDASDSISSDNSANSLVEQR